MRSLLPATIAFLAAFLCAAHFGQAGDDAKLEPGFTLLFNGKNFDGWKTRSGETLDGKTEAYKGRFKAVNGSIVIDPAVKGDSTIMSAKEFKGDTHIKFEFKAGEKCNNDIYFRGGKFDLTLKVKGLKDGWNDFEIVAAGDKVECTVNGQKLNGAKNKGVGAAFGIRAEFGAIEIRRIRVKE